MTIACWFAYLEIQARKLGLVDSFVEQEMTYLHSKQESYESCSQNEWAGQKVGWGNFDNMVIEVC